MSAGATFSASALFSGSGGSSVAYRDDVIAREIRSEELPGLLSATAGAVHELVGGSGESVAAIACASPIHVIAASGACVALGCTAIVLEDVSGNGVADMGRSLRSAEASVVVTDLHALSKVLRASSKCPQLKSVVVFGSERESRALWARLQSLRSSVLSPLVLRIVDAKTASKQPLPASEASGTSRVLFVRGSHESAFFSEENILSGVERVASEIECTNGSNKNLFISAPPASHQTFMYICAALSKNIAVQYSRSQDALAHLSGMRGAAVAIFDAPRFLKLSHLESVHSHDLSALKKILNIGAASTETIKKCCALFSASGAKDDAKLEVEAIQFSDACLGRLFVASNSTYPNFAYKDYPDDIICAGELAHDVECKVFSRSSSDARSHRTRTAGEIWIRGRAVGSRDDSHEAFVHSNMVGFCDSDGLWYILPRLGASESAIEELVPLLSATPSVKDAAAVIWSHAALPNELIVFLARSAGADESANCALQSLSSYTAQNDVCISETNILEVSAIPKINGAVDALLLKEYFCSYTGRTFMGFAKIEEVFGIAPADPQTSDVEWIQAQGIVDRGVLKENLNIAITTISGLNNKLSQAHREVERLSAELTEQSGSGGLLKAELDDALSELEKLRKDFDEARAESERTKKSLEGRDSLLTDIRSQRDSLQSQNLGMTGELEATKQAMFEANRRAKHSLSSLEAERKSNAEIIEEHKALKQERFDLLERIDAAEIEIVTASQNRGVLAGQLDAARCELQVSRASEARTREELKITCEEIFHMRERLANAESARAREAEANALRIEELIEADKRTPAHDSATRFAEEALSGEEVARLLSAAAEEMRYSNKENARLFDLDGKTRIALANCESRLEEMQEVNEILKVENAVAIAYLAEHATKISEPFTPIPFAPDRHTIDTPEGNADVPELVPAAATAAASPKVASPKRKVRQVSIHRSGSMDLSFVDSPKHSNARTSDEVASALTQIQGMFEENQLTWPLEPIPNILDGFRFADGLGTTNSFLVKMGPNKRLLVFDLGSEGAKEGKNLLEFLAQAGES